MRIPLPVKLMASYLLVAGLIVVPALVLLRRSLLESLEEAEERELQAKAEALRERIENVPADQLDPKLRELAPLLQLRITLIQPDGKVLNDTDLEPDRVPKMENHANRPEVRAALANGVGASVRLSATLNKELTYVAVTMPAKAKGPTQAVLRLASPVSNLHEPVRRVFVGLRLASGVGVSAAILLSLVSALVVTRPLRRMRDTALAFSQSRWVEVPDVRTGDELEELSLALRELGQKLRGQLIAVGAQEALLTQAVTAFPLPAALLREDLQAMQINGAFRAYAGITAANEPERVSALAAVQRLQSAKSEAVRTGLPVELALVPPEMGHDASAHRALLVPLVRPGAALLWLLIADIDGPESEARGPEAVHRLLRSAEVLVERLWDVVPPQRETLARLRLKLDEAAHAAGRPEAVDVEPVSALQLLERAAEEVRALEPEIGKHLLVEAAADRSGMVAESAGLGARAVRRFLRGALKALPVGRNLVVSIQTEAVAVRFQVDGAAPLDLEPVRELARALGSEVGRVEAREREAAWLSLPRA
jgi:HAMP domain-containing protein